MITLSESALYILYLSPPVVVLLQPIEISSGPSPQSLHLHLAELDFDERELSHLQDDIKKSSLGKKCPDAVANFAISPRLF